MKIIIEHRTGTQTSDTWSGVLITICLLVVASVFVLTSFSDFYIGFGFASVFAPVSEVFAENRFHYQHILLKQIRLLIL